MDKLKERSIQSLGQGTIGDLPADIKVPVYDRAALRPGIVHIGLGNFHRAHQAWYTHRLMQDGRAQDWAIIGAGVRPGDAKMRDRLLAQDCLTTLIELSPDGVSAEVTGSMIDFIPVEDDNASLIAQMSDPAIRIVSLTVTEGGYYRNAATGHFDPEHPDMVADAATPSTPKTAFGAIIAALSHRRATGQPAFTVLSCDNLQGNGNIAREVIVSLARMSDPDLGAWIDKETCFPNSMVDCIVPATGETEIGIARALGVADAAPVTHENFRQWVIEDRFSAGRPDWDQVGATFSDDVHAYESMKIRILNAGHQVLANAGELLSQATIDACIAHPEISAFFDRVQHEEIVPYVADVPDMTAPDYAKLIAKRFANTAIKDTTRRVAFDGSSRHTGFILPVLRDALAAGGSIEGLSLCEALWARMCAGIREDGSEIAPNDPLWDQLVVRAFEARDRQSAWLEQSDIYGALAQDARFVQSFENWLKSLWVKGVNHTLKTYIAGG